VRIGRYPALAMAPVWEGWSKWGRLVALTSYGEVVEVSAIVGSRLRGGVAMSGANARSYGHF